MNLPLLHPNGCNISFAKHQDIMSLMKYVPPCLRAFYQGLKHDGSMKNADVDLDLSFGDSEEESTQRGGLWPRTLDTKTVHSGKINKGKV